MGNLQKTKLLSGNKKVNLCVTLLGVMGCCVLLAGCNQQSQTVQADLPFEMPAVNDPVIPNQTFSIVDYGAVADGHTKNTTAFSRTIDACVQAGGGRVLVPAGLWLTGPIELKSRLNLHLAQGAVVVFSPDIEDYPLVRKTYEGSESVRRMSPLTGVDLDHIAITGSGVFDGSGQAWRHVKKEKLTDREWKNLVSSGGVLDQAKRIWYPSEQALNGAQIVKELNQRNAGLQEYAAAGEYLRPTLVSLAQCKNVLLEGVTFQNSPSWNVHPLMCENVIIRNVNLRNPWWAQNGDGLDLESCRNVLVYGCRFDVGDDAICMKSGRNEYGRQRGMPTENVDIRDCIVYHGHGGFVIGSEMSGGVRNISVKNCDFLGTDIGLRFKSTRGRGGVVENIFVENIHMAKIPEDAIRFNMFYEAKSPGSDQLLEMTPDAVSDETPCFRKIYLKNVVCHGAKNAIYMLGLPEMPIQDIYFENVKISSEIGMTGIHLDRIFLKDVSLFSKKGPLYMWYGCMNMNMENMTLPESDETVLRLVGKETGPIRLTNVKMPSGDQIEYGPGVKENVIVRD